MVTRKNFTIHGPMWQAECQRCEELSDVYDSPPATDEFVMSHKCAETEYSLRRQIRFLEDANEELRRQIERFDFDAEST